MDLDKTDTGFRYMLEAYRIGGPYMHIITLFGILALVIAIWKVAGLIKKSVVELEMARFNQNVRIIALAVGFMSQIVGIVKALEEIRAAADVSPQIVMKGAIMSFYAPIWGFIVFIFSMLIYYILKEIIKARLS